MTGRWRLGVLGGGDIAPRYMNSLRHAANVDLVAAASRSPQSAQKCAQLFGGAAVTPDELLEGELVDAVVLLTPPQHHETAIARAIDNGLHVYCEKPFALSLDRAEALARLAASRGVMLAAAPAVHLGPSLNSARTMIDTGTIGQVIGGSATLVYPGPDLWHHNPDHLFADGGGPLWDMGVYHLAALVFLLGPVAAVQAAGSQARAERVVRQGLRAGSAVPVSIPTHVTALVRFVSGALITLTFSFDGFGSRAPGLELYGTKGAIAIGHPNAFAAPLHVSTKLREWDLVQDTSGWRDTMWAIGVVEALDALGQRRMPRTSTEFAAHVIEIMAAIELLCRQQNGAAKDIASRCLRPAPIIEYKVLPWMV